MVMVAASANQKGPRADARMSLMFIWRLPLVCKQYSKGASVTQRLFTKTADVGTFNN